LPGLDRTLRGEQVMTSAFRFAWIVVIPLGLFALGGEVRGQPGFGGGPGMFGGSRGMFGGGPPASLSLQCELLLGSPTVQKELGLSEDQNAQIKEVRDKARTAMRESFSGLRDLSPQEQQARFAEMRSKMQARSEETKAAIEAVLLPKQRERLKGIALQTMGTRAFQDKQVQRELELEEYQVAVMRVIEARSRKKIGELSSAGGDPESLGPKIDELRKEAEKQVLDVLTDPQKAALEKMKGEKLEIPVSELRGSRGRGGRGGSPRSREGGGTEGGPPAPEGPP
jgi:hypothetical protein